MLNFLLRKLRNWKKNQRGRAALITIEINRKKLLNNLHNLQKVSPNWQIAPVLKSNAYGHGINLIATILEKEANLPFFCIDSYFEAEQLRHQGIKKPLLILGYTPTATISSNKLKNIHFTVGGFEQLKNLIEQKNSQTIQIKFDTGMHRQGLDYKKIDLIMELLKKNTALKIAGVLSHLADAETSNSEVTQKQIFTWNNLVEKLQNNFSDIKYYHLTNSAGLFHHKKIKANVGRVGLALYGINLNDLPINLQPILKMTSLISEIREIEQGESVGYNNTFVATAKTKIATVPCGYYEGVDRRLSNRGVFLIANQPAPLIGKVSMNISSCNITEITEANLGSQVVIISDHLNDPNSTQNIASLCQTIPYEILVHLPAHLRRIVV